MEGSKCIDCLRWSWPNWQYHIRTKSVLCHTPCNKNLISWKRVDQMKQCSEVGHWQCGETDQWWTSTDTIRMQHQFGEQLRNLFLKQIARWTNCKTTNDDGKSLGMMLAPHEARHNFSGSLCTKYPKSIQNVTGIGNKVGGTAWKETGWQKSLKEVGITVYWSYEHEVSENVADKALPLQGNVSKWAQLRRKRRSCCKDFGHACVHNSDIINFMYAAKERFILVQTNNVAKCNGIYSTK